MRIATAPALLLALVLTPGASAQVAQPLPFAQNWTDTGLITTNDDWSGVAGIIGYRGDELVGATAVDPQTVVADGSATPVDVNANQADPSTFNTGGVAEFEIANPVVALNGSGTADAPHIVIRVNTTGIGGVRVRYNLRDLDSSVDNAIQPIALQYRVGTAGDFTNVPAGFVPDATEPDAATLVTPVDVTLPPDADNQSSVDIRVITTNAAGNDEWVGVDDIQVSSATVANEPGAGSAALSLEVNRNPVGGSAQVRYLLTEATSTRLAVYDVTGREVAVLAVGARPAGVSTATLDMSRLAPGTYVLRLSTGVGTVARTVTVAR